MNKKSIRLFVLVSISVFMFLCSLFRFADLKGLLTKTDSYLKADGLIIKSEIIRGRYYYYDIEYTYAVNNVSYTKSKVDFGPTRSASKKLAQSYIEKYPVGKKVSVFYLPNTPQFSVLDLSVNDSALLLFPFIMITCLIWTIFILWNDRQYWSYKLRTYFNKSIREQI